MNTYAVSCGYRTNKGGAVINEQLVIEAVSVNDAWSKGQRMCMGRDKVLFVTIIRPFDQ